MKARYITISETELNQRIRSTVEAELIKYKDEVYDKVTWDVFQQALAVCFTALELMGWRKKRLAEFQQKVEAAAQIITTGVMGREYSTRQALKHLHEAYGIKFEQDDYDGEREETA